jgi:hypothetical protein
MRLMQKHEYKVKTLQASARDFIEIEFVDEDGNPVADEDYILFLPDGSQRKGKVDSEGYAVEKDVPSGEITVEFPNIEELDVEE